MKTYSRYETEKIAKGQCIEYRCSKPYCKRKGYRCHRCDSRRFKEQNPSAYHYNALRNNARRRGKEFSLTLEEFRDFCEETNYLELKGCHPNDYTIDRIDIEKGYSRNNIQMMRNGENVRKYYAYESKGIPYPKPVPNPAAPEALPQPDELEEVEF